MKKLFTFSILAYLPLAVLLGAITLACSTTSGSTSKQLAADEINCATASAKAAVQAALPDVTLALTGTNYTAVLKTQALTLGEDTVNCAVAALEKALSTTPDPTAPATTASTSAPNALTSRSSLTAGGSSKRSTVQTNAEAYLSTLRKKPIL